MQLEISGQQSRFEEVITNAETIYEMTDAERTEYRRLLMSFTGASINIDISREVHRMYILENPKERVSLLSNAEDLLVVLPEIETGTIDIQDIKSQFLLHPDVLRYFSRGDFRENDFKYLPTPPVSRPHQQDGGEEPHHGHRHGRQPVRRRRDRWGKADRLSRGSGAGWRWIDHCGRCGCRLANRRSRVATDGDIR